MNNNDIDNLLYKLRKQMDKGFEDKELSIFFINDCCSRIISKEFSIDNDNISDLLIRKMISDFYAYYLYKIELGDDIDNLSLEIVQDLKSLDCDDVLNYVKYNLNKFYIIIKNYFEFCDKDIVFKEEVMANIVNKRLGIEISSLYRDYFCSDLNYEKYLLSNSVIVGLDLIDTYAKNKNDKDIIQFLNIEFEDKIFKYKFLNYILSNVYAYLKLNGCSNDFDVKLVNLTDKIANRMKCFYDDEEFVLKLVKKYFNIYKDVRWFEFKDVRDYLPFEQIDLIYKLDDSYKHPSDVIKNATNIFTILEDVQSFLNDNIERLSLLEMDDFEISQWIKGLLNYKTVVHYSENTIFKLEDDNYFRNLIRLYLLTSYYEYSNYNNLDDNENALFKYIDKGISMDEAISVFDDEDDCNLIIDRCIDYYFSKENTEILARNKIIEDKRFAKVLKFNPFVFLDYRRSFGTLFPLETSKSTEYGNVILGTLFDIISLSDDLEDEHGIKYQDIAQMFKNDFFDIHLDLDEILGFILTNIYENLINKDNLDNVEKDFIINMENYFIDIDDLCENDDFLGQLLVYFFNLNGEYFNDEKLKKLRNNGGKRKTKILQKYDPFYEIDKDILK